MVKKLLVFLFVVVLLTTLISSAPPFQENKGSVDGLQLYYPQYEYIKQSTPFNLNVHVSNISNGVQFNNTQVDCYIHLHNSTGYHTYESAALGKNSNGLDHEILIDGGNFTDLGSHSLYIWCNRTVDNLGGGIRETFKVTIAGEELTEGKSILYVGLFGILIFLFVSGFVGIGLLPSKNTQDEEGKILSISYAKYFRNVLWMFEWVLLMAILYLGSNVAFAYMDSAQLAAKILFNISVIMFALTPIIVTVWLVWIFRSMFHDKEFQNLLNKGIFPQGRNW